MLDTQFILEQCSAATTKKIIFYIKYINIYSSSLIKHLLFLKNTLMVLGSLWYAYKPHQRIFQYSNFLSISRPRHFFWKRSSTPGLRVIFGPKCFLTKFIIIMTLRQLQHTTLDSERQCIMP